VVSDSVGAICFGFVVGWVTYRTLRRSNVSGLSDLATVIGAVGGAAVTGLFSKESGAFGSYCVGLAVGFFLYFVVSLGLASKSGQSAAVNEWLGEAPQPGTQAGRGGNPLPPVSR
jgi:hypothetical protein